MDRFADWLGDILNEDNTRYSVEVNFRTHINDVLRNYAKIALGYVSAALKAADYHVKQVFDDNLVRVLVSSRNWDDGEWVVIVSWNPHHNKFFLSRGFYNKLAKDISVQHQEACKATNAAEIAALVKNVMHHLKQVPDRHIEKLKKVPLKTGPKK